MLRQIRLAATKLLLQECRLLMSNYEPVVQAYLDKNARWNFTANFLDLTFSSLGLSFIFSSTVLSLYISYLYKAALLIGIIPAIQGVGYYFPQLFLARIVERLPRKKPLTQIISVMERFPFAIVGGSLLLWPQSPNWLAYTILASSLALTALASGLAMPSWRGMLAKVIPVERRGMLFGGSAALGGLLGVGGAALSRHILAHYPYPTSFGICFMLCFVFQVCSWVCLSLNREPAVQSTIAPRTAKDYWKRLPTLLLQNTNYTRYLVARTLLILGGMSSAFYVIYARRAFATDNAFAANLTIAALVSMTISAPILGRLADRLGHKLLTELCTLIAIGGVLLALVAPSAAWFYAVFVVITAAGAGFAVAGANLTMEFSAEELPTYTALADTLLAIPVLLSPIIGGWLVDTLGFKPTFTIAFTMYAIGWIVLHWLVHEPRFAHKRQPSSSSVPDEPNT
ncbi:MAG: MFS transporter [Armatimonadota bacterium]